MKNRRTGRKDSFPRAMLISAICHAMIISIIILFPPGLFINAKKPMEITWVELPKGTGEDIYGLKDVQRLPESTIEEQQEIPQKDLKPLAEDKKVMPEPKVEEKKEEPPKKPATKAPSRQEAALAKIEQRLKERQASPEAAQVDSTGEGYVYGTSDRPNRVPVTDPEYLKYQALVRRRILGQWVIPGAVTQIPPEKRPVVRIIVLINRSGHVISKRWAKKSAIESLNASAMRAIERASPFPIPPERLKWEAYNEGFLVEFNARGN